MNALAFRPVDRKESALVRIATWRRAAYQVATDFEADLCEHLGLNAGQARILAALYRARCPVGREVLAEAADVTSKTLSLYLAGLREALGPGCLPRADRDGGGYRLTQAGRRECERATEEAGLQRLWRDLSGATA